VGRFLCYSPRNRSRNTKGFSGKSDNERLWEGWAETEIKRYEEMEIGAWEAKRGSSSRMEWPLLSCPCHWPSSISTYYSDAGMLFDGVTGGSLDQHEVAVREGIIYLEPRTRN